MHHRSYTDRQAAMDDYKRRGQGVAQEGSSLMHFGGGGYGAGETPRERMMRERRAEGPVKGSFKTSATNKARR
jgi:hypothetical protein